jgi:LysR family hydrogen peroxide-inducible transcriptional activator
MNATGASFSLGVRTCERKSGTNRPTLLGDIQSWRLAADRSEENDPFLLLKEGHCFRENTLSACGRAKVQPNVVFESGQFTTILAMVAAGTGVSVVPHMAVEAREGCCFIPLGDENAYRRIGIVQLKQHFRSRTHHAFLKHLQQSQTQSEQLIRQDHPAA